MTSGPHHMMRYASRLIKLRPITPSPSSTLTTAHDLCDTDPLPPSSSSLYMTADDGDGDDDDAASQLTYLSELVRESRLKKRRYRYDDEQEDLPSLVQPPPPPPLASHIKKKRPFYVSFASVSTHLFESSSVEDPVDTAADWVAGQGSSCCTLKRNTYSAPHLPSATRSPQQHPGRLESPPCRRVYSTPSPLSSCLGDDNDSTTDSSDDEEEIRPCSTAYLISLPPTAAAAASVARKRRWESKQRFSSPECNSLYHL